MGFALVDEGPHIFERGPACHRADVGNSKFLRIGKRFGKVTPAAVGLAQAVVMPVDALERVRVDENPREDRKEHAHKFGVECKFANRSRTIEMDQSIVHSYVRSPGALRRPQTVTDDLLYS